MTKLQYLSLLIVHKLALITLQARNLSIISCEGAGCGTRNPLTAFNLWCRIVRLRRRELRINHTVFLQSAYRIEIKFSNDIVPRTSRDVSPSLFKRSCALYKSCSQCRDVYYAERCKKLLCILDVFGFTEKVWHFMNMQRTPRHP